LNLHTLNWIGRRRILSKRGLWPLFLRKQILSIEYHRYSSTGKRIQPKNKDLELNLYSSLDFEVMIKIVDTLVYLVREKFEPVPFSGKVFLFCGGKQDSFKALYWEGQGY